MRVLISFVLVLMAFGGYAQTKEVLFIGNSYTGQNNLPKMVSDVAKSAGDTLLFDAHTPGGNRLMQHASNALANQKIKQKLWDYVVLQAQSQEPSFADWQVQQDVFPYAKILCDTIRASYTCSQPMFYMTWGRENGDQGNCPFFPPLCTYKGMDSMLNLRYRAMGADNDADVAPVGAVWHYIRDKYPNMDLYKADGSHPTLTGSYIAACTFYTMIFQKDPTKITASLGVNALDALNIRLAAKAVVYDSLSNWTMTKPEPTAKFSQLVVGDTVFLSNNSENALWYEWDFGDGNTSTDENPKHIYTSNGTYKITLKTIGCGGVDAVNELVEIDFHTGTNSMVKRNSILAFPNPMADQLYVKGADGVHELVLLDLSGREASRVIFKGDASIDVSSLKPGFYFIEILDRKTGESLVSKVVKQ